MAYFLFSLAVSLLIPLLGLLFSLLLLHGSGAAGIYLLSILFFVVGGVWLNSFLASLLMTRRNILVGGLTFLMQVIWIFYRTPIGDWSREWLSDWIPC